MDRKDSKSDEADRNTTEPVTEIHWSRWETILGTILYAAMLASMLFGAGMYLIG